MQSPSLFLLLRFSRLLEHVRPGQFEEHQSGLGYSLVPPLRYSARRYLAQLSHSRGSAAVVNNLVFIHSPILVA